MTQQLYIKTDGPIPEGCGYITAGRVYPVSEFQRVTVMPYGYVVMRDDNGMVMTANVGLATAHLGGGSFTFCDQLGTPVPAPWEEVEPLPCDRCGASAPEFTIPNDIWNRVIRTEGKERDDEYICKDCWHSALRAALGINPSAHAEAGDTCDKCGREYTAVYRVPNHVWAKIAPKPETLDDSNYGGGMLCPDCAATAAKALGIRLVFAADIWEEQPSPHSCKNCLGIDPDSCMMNRGRLTSWQAHAEALAEALRMWTNQKSPRRTAAELLAYMEQCTDKSLAALAAFDQGKGVKRG